MQEQKTQKGLSERLSSAIKASGLSIRKFSESSGVPYSSLRDYMSGKKVPGADALASIVRASKVSADWILFGEEAVTNTKINKSLLTMILSIAFQRISVSRRFSSDLVSKYADNLEKLIKENPPGLHERISGLDSFKDLKDIGRQRAADLASTAAFIYEDLRAIDVDSPEGMSAAIKRATDLVDVVVSVLEERDEREEKNIR